jgi:hypothetical protein
MASTHCAPLVFVFLHHLQGRLCCSRACGPLMGEPRTARDQAEPTEPSISEEGKLRAKNGRLNFALSIRLPRNHKGVFNVPLFCLRSIVVSLRPSKKYRSKSTIPSCYILYILATRVTISSVVEWATDGTVKLRCFMYVWINQGNNIHKDGEVITHLFHGIEKNLMHCLKNLCK